MSVVPLVIGQTVATTEGDFEKAGGGERSRQGERRVGVEGYTHARVRHL